MRVYYVVAAEKERTARALKIANALKAEIIDCRSRIRRYTTFPIKLFFKLVMSDCSTTIVNNIPAHILLPCLLATKLRRSLVVVDFVNLWEYAVRKKYHFLSWAVKRYESWIYSKVKYALAINHILAERAREKGVQKIQVVLDAADHTRFRPSYVRTPTIAIAANFRHDEGLDVLLQAMKIAIQRHPEAVCRIAGKGEEEDSLKRLAQDLKLSENVVFDGWVDYDKMPSFYRLASIGVAPMRDISPTALPIKIFEYLASGLATVATDTPATRTVIREGENGLLVAAGKPDELANSICKLLGDDELMVRLQRGARRTVEEGLNWQAQVKLLVAFLAEIHFCASEAIQDQPSLNQGSNESLTQSHGAKPYIRERMSSVSNAKWF